MMALYFIVQNCIRLQCVQCANYNCNNNETKDDIQEQEKSHMIFIIVQTNLCTASAHTAPVHNNKHKAAALFSLIRISLL